MRVISENNKEVMLDKRDRKILNVLALNSRVSLRTIGKAVKLSPQTVEYRINRLKQNGIITGFRTIVDLSSLGNQRYHFFLNCDDKMLKVLKSRPEVNALLTFSGRWSVECSITASSPFEAEKLLNELGFKDYALCIIIKTVRSSLLPYYEEEINLSLKKEDSSFSKTFSLPKKKVVIDEKDLELLKLLSQDAQMSLVNLSNKLKISKDTVKKRIVNLIRGRFIQRFVPIVNFAALKLRVYAVLVRGSLESALSDEGVIWCAKVLGSYDYIIYFADDERERIHQFCKKLNNYEILIGNEELVYTYLPPFINFKKYHFD